MVSRPRTCSIREKSTASSNIMVGRHSLSSISNCRRVLHGHQLSGPGEQREKSAFETPEYQRPGISDTQFIGDRIHDVLPDKGVSITKHGDFEEFFGVDGELSSPNIGQVQPSLHPNTATIHSLHPSGSSIFSQPKEAPVPCGFPRRIVPLPEKSPGGRPTAVFYTEFPNLPWERGLLYWAHGNDNSAPVSENTTFP